MTYRWLAFLCSMLIFISLPSAARDNKTTPGPKDMGGWEKGSPCNKLYNLNDVDSFKAGRFQG
jgi:hypothetical protein